MQSPAFSAPLCVRTSLSQRVSPSPLRALSPRTRVSRAAVRRVACASLGDKYGDLRGADVPPVSEAVTAFVKAFARPVPIVYRGLVNEVVVSTHLARVCAMWRYCKVFAFGLDEIFEKLMVFYPEGEGGMGEGGEKDSLYAAVCGALKFEKETIKEDAEEVREWLAGKSEEDVFEAAKAGEGPVGEAFAAARDGSKEGVLEWYYSRMFGIGVIRVMETVGVEMDVATAEKWCGEMGLPVGAVGVEMGSYLSMSERMKQAEQMFAEVAARDARKTAERLAEKAEKAKKKAEALESGDGDDEEAGGVGEGATLAPVAAAGEE